MRQGANRTRDFIGWVLTHHGLDAGQVPCADAPLHASRFTLHASRHVPCANQANTGARVVVRWVKTHPMAVLRRFERDASAGHATRRESNARPHRVSLDPPWARRSTLDARRSTLDARQAPSAKRQAPSAKRQAPCANRRCAASRHTPTKRTPERGSRAGGSRPTLWRCSAALDATRVPGTRQGANRTRDFIGWVLTHPMGLALA
jgi:hypothetical protein